MVTSSSLIVWKRQEPSPGTLPVGGHLTYLKQSCFTSGLKYVDGGFSEMNLTPNSEYPCEKISQIEGIEIGLSEERAVVAVDVTEDPLLLLIELCEGDLLGTTTGSTRSGAGFSLFLFLDTIRIIGTNLRIKAGASVEEEEEFLKLEVEGCPAATVGAWPDLLLTISRAAFVLKLLMACKTVSVDSLSGVNVSVV